MEIQAAEVHVYAAHHCHAVVADKAFGVDKTGDILVDFDAERGELTVVRAGDRVYKPLIGNVRRDNPHVHAAFCREGKSVLHLVVDNEVRGSDIDILLRVVDDVEVDVFTDGFIVKRAVGVRDNKAV